ncbi:hypothetical protein LTS08_006531 [Lithohypha guttulata]|nr:hypothetical protein LTS08_006531 [Lithohypha guttulata]
MAQAKGTIPSLAPERVCRKMFTDSRYIRDRIWPRTLTIEEKVSVKGVVKQLAQHSKFTWLRGHITEVVFNEVSSYALSTQPHWKGLALACPGLRSFHIHQRARRGYVDWDPREYEEIAVAEDPDDRNLQAIQPKTFEKLAACLHRNHGDNYTVTVESCIWWSLMLTSPQECLKKINIYSFKQDKHDMVSRTFEVERLVDLRAAETHLNDDWSP